MLRITDGVLRFMAVAPPPGSRRAKAGDGEPEQAEAPA